MTSARNPEADIAVLEATRGFSSLFWGMPVLATAHAMALTGTWPIRWLIGSLLAGHLPVLLGLWRLKTSGLDGPGWARRLRQALWLAAGAMYFSPFVAWWHLWPEQPLFGVEAIVHYGVVMGLLIALCRLAGEASTALGDSTLRREAQVGILLVAGIALICAGLWIWMNRSTRGVPLGWGATMLQLDFLVGQARAVLLLPYASTAYVMWRAKEAGFRRTVQVDEAEPPGNGHD